MKGANKIGIKIILNTKRHFLYSSEKGNCFLFKFSFKCRTCFRDSERDHSHEQLYPGLITNFRRLKYLFGLEKVQG